MIKSVKLLFLSFLLCMPMVAVAADHCTNPDEYTVDRRCYVTDEQKAQKPFNSVVALIDGGGIYCTGTVVTPGTRYSPFFSYNTPNQIPVIVTDKHCIDRNHDGQPDQRVKIMLQNGQKLDVNLLKTGNYNILDSTNDDGDWAVYQLPPVYYATYMQENLDSVYASFSSGLYSGVNVSVIGYGFLKIMSDAEIEEFRQRYIDYLTENNLSVPEKRDEFSYKTDYSQTGMLSDGGVDMGHDPLNDFLITEYIKDSSYINDTFSSEYALKVSKCKYLGRDDDLCQTWGGNSGGGYFNNQDDILCILTKGKNIIGGFSHAAATKCVVPDATAYYAK